MSDGATTATLPTTAGAVGAETGGASVAAVPSFIDNLPQEYRAEPKFLEFAKAENPLHEMAKSYLSAQTLIGKKSTGIEIPGADATPEAIAAFNKAIGVPEKPDGYEYKLPDLSKESETLQKYMQSSRDENFTKAMQAAAHQAGITPKQFSAMAQALDGHSLNLAKAALENGTKAAQTRLDEQTKFVKSHYGDAYDSVERVAKDTIAKVVPEAIRNTRDPEIVMVEMARFIHENMFKGDKVLQTGSESISGEGSLREQIMAARQDLAKMNWQQPGYKEAEERVRALYKREAELKTKQ